jgi:ABC-2 type transport system permease protein
VLGARVSGRPSLLAAVVLTWPVAVLGLGLMLATLVRSHGQLGTASDLGALVISVLGGALTPVSALPDWMRAVSVVSPGYWAVTGYREALLGEPGGAALPPVLVIVLVGVGAGGVAALAASANWRRQAA